MKTTKKSLKSFSPKIRNAIIDIVGPEWSGLYKESEMSNKAPAWFQAFEEKQDALHKEILMRLDRIESDINDIKNTPTMKKELK